MAIIGNVSKGGASKAFGIDIDISPSPIILMASFDALSLSVKSFHEPLKRAVQEVIAPSIRRNFDVGGRPTWEPIADGTFMQKASYGWPAEDTLIRTGSLQRIAGQLNIWTIDRDSAFIGDLPDKVWYGKVHQSGLPKVNIPQRAFALIQDEDLPKIDEVFDEWLGERLARTGF